MNGWFKVAYKDIMLNGLSCRQIGAVVKYRGLCEFFEKTELNEKQLKENFDFKERKFLIEYFELDIEIKTKNSASQHEVYTKPEQLPAEADTNSAQIQNEAGTDLAQSGNEVSTDLEQTQHEVGTGFLFENNGLTKSSNIYNINNNIINKEKKEREKERKKTISETTLEEIATYVAEKELIVDPQTFFNYFSEGGWKDSEGKPVKNWKQKLITWDSRERQKRTLQAAKGLLPKAVGVKSGTYAEGTPL